MNIWKVIQNGNSLKRTGRDRDGRVIILPPMTADEHIAVQRESKARTTLLQSIPDDYVANFYYMDDARDIWNAVKAKFGKNVESKKMRKSMLKQEFLEFRIGEAEGLHKGYDRMQKILSQLNQLKAKPEDEDINLKFLRAFPSSWSQVALTLKTKGGLELLSFDDLYYNLKTLEVDVKGYNTFSSSQSAGPSHYAFPEQQLAYEDFEQIEKLDLEEMDLKWQMAMLSVRVHKFEQKARKKIGFDKKKSTRFNKKNRYSSFKINEIGKKEEDSKALITVDTLVDWTDHDGKSDEVIASKEFGMIAGCDIEDAIEEGAAKIYNLITGADTEEASTADDAREFALMGVTSKMSYGTKSSSSSDSKSMSNDFVSCDNSDKSSEVNTNDFAFSDSSVKSSEPKLNDSTSCASTSCVSISDNETEIKSNVGTPIQDPIIVQDLPSFSCNNSDKNEKNFRTSCNKNGYFNKRQDCDFYEKQMVNKTVGIGVKPIHSRKKVNHQNQFVPQVVLIRTDKVNIPPARPQPVPTGKPKENPFPDAEDEEIFDSGCSRSMTGNKERLDDFQEFQVRKVTLGGGKGRITGKGTIRTPTLDFENVYYVKELQQFNLFSIS
uniref:Ribonuclease H-like domain-containing protein n=1 Tax=Tanacetum cinerariifolium TaxID=118510 RepID=A0A6L2LUQ8_TANCI|nr:ribonuclease H-like domain-containing protein [Tanacetum cinerariifolium]